MKGSGKEESLPAEILENASYEKKYFEECKIIWKKLVPQQGQAESLQGELLRVVEKLRYEAQQNGNINWDDDFAYFCDFLQDNLCQKECSEGGDDVYQAIARIRSHGDYAAQYVKDIISDKEADFYKMAYVKDNLYDIIADGIGYYYLQRPEPVPYKHTREIKR